MNMTAAVHVSDESPILDVVKVDVPEVAGLGLWKTLALITFSALSAGGFFYALVEILAGPKPDSAAEATEELLRQPAEPSAIAVGIVIVLVVAVAGAAAVVALRRHADY